MLSLLQEEVAIVVGLLNGLGKQAAPSGVFQEIAACADDLNAPFGFVIGVVAEFVAGGLFAG